MFWNLENFFDWRDDGGGEADTEFSSSGARHWTRRRFQAKARAIGKTLVWAGGIAGRLPDLFGVAEIENAFVLDKLLDEEPLRKLEYGYVHFDSPDRRGIDVGLLYRRSVFQVVSSRAVPVRAAKDGDTLRTRDILLTCLEDGRGDRWNVLVCHFPSKYGGGDSDWRREAAGRILRQVCDSLLAAGEERVLAMGDFNDTPDSPALQLLSGPMVNLAAPLAARGQGSIRFEGRWQLIDHMYVSPSLAARSTLEILHPPFLTTHDNVHSGDKPLRTYLGPRYTGGVSDHRPLLLRLDPPPPSATPTLASPPPSISTTSALPPPNATPLSHRPRQAPAPPPPCPRRAPPLTPPCSLPLSRHPTAPLLLLPPRGFVQEIENKHSFYVQAPAKQIKSERFLRGLYRITAQEGENVNKPRQTKQR